MPKPPPVVVPMEHEKDTKNMVRYQYSGSDDKPPITKLYVEKELIEKWGKPENLNVTLEAP